MKVDYDTLITLFSSFGIEWEKFDEEETTVSAVDTDGDTLTFTFDDEGELFNTGSESSFYTHSQI